MQVCEEGDLSRRARPACKEIIVSQKLLRTVDDLIVEEYQKGRTYPVEAQLPGVCRRTVGHHQGKANLCGYDEETTKSEAEGG